MSSTQYMTQMLKLQATISTNQERLKWLEKDSKEYETIKSEGTKAFAELTTLKLYWGID